MSDQTDVQNDDQTDPKPGDKSTTGKQADQKAAGSGAGDETHAGYVTEESYKGLQTAMNRQKTKLENELLQLKEKLEKQAADLEEAKLAAEEKTKLETSQKDLNTSIQTLQAERDKLTRQLNQQKIVLAEFPQLAPLATYIPPADTDDAFKANATSFEAALKQYVSLVVSKQLEGAGPPIGSGNQSSQTDNTTDKLWADVDKYAGIPGKEKEFEEANAKLQEALKLRNKSS